MLEMVLVLKLLAPIAGPYSHAIIKTSTKHGFNPLLVAAVVKQESKFRNGICHQGAHGLMQIQLQPRSCERTMEVAKEEGLYQPAMNIKRGVEIMTLWRGWVEKTGMQHHWLLNFNQGYGRCPRGVRRCDLRDRRPVDTGYARRVLSTYRMFRFFYESLRREHVRKQERAKHRREVYPGEA